MKPTIALLTVPALNSRPIEFVRLELDQMFNDHHRAEIVLDLERMGADALTSPLSKSSMINEKVIIDIQEQNGGSSYTFSGLITDVQIELDKGSHGLMYIYAASSTIELERGKMLQTFSDTDLSEIVGDVTKGLIRLRIQKNPKYTSPIKFSMQYKETDFQYLRRLAWMYGEKFFYTGEELVFGNHPALPTVNVTYDLDLKKVRICTRLVANTFQQYYHTVDFEKSLFEHPLSEGGTFAGEASAKSDMLNMGKKPDMPMDVPVFDDGSLQNITKMRKERTFTNMYYVTGETKLYKLRIGGLLQVDFGKLKVDDSLGSLRIIKIKHVFDSEDRYHNEFQAVTSKFDRIPFPDIDIPVAHAIPAEVTANEDPDGLGKIQVKFDFEDKYCDYWMPVMMPEAGGPENRGYIFVPEINDKVLVSFFEGNPEFPFILGSMFHGKNGKGIGGGAGNHIKSMRDKSGSEVVLNDKDGSAKLFSKKGNSTVFLDGKGNVSISTPNTITLSATDINLNAGNSINLKAKPQKEGSGEGLIDLTAQKSITVTSEIDTINITSDKTLSLTSNSEDLALRAKTGMSLDADDITITGTSSLKASSSDTDIM